VIGRHVAPAGAPIEARDLARWARRWTDLPGATEELRQAICAALGRRHCFFVSTGRAGLTILLSALEDLASQERDEVVLPSYTCYSVPASVVRAGLRPRIVDVDPATLDFDLEKLGNSDFRRVLAIVSTGLYGLPGRMACLAAIARDRGVYLVDDAAQTLGASVDGVPAGAWGDAGLLSFDKGKAVSAIDGGAVVADSDDLAASLARRLLSLPAPSFSTSVAHAAKLAAYVTCLRPQLYWIPNAVPGLGLGRTEYRTDFVIERESPWLAALAATMWPRLSEFTAARLANAERYRQGLPRDEGLRHVEPVRGSCPSYLRFAMLVRDPSLRARLLHDLPLAGIGATASYPGSIADIPELQKQLAGRTDAAGGREVAARIVTLPTHPYASAPDVDHALGIVTTAVGGER